MFRPIKNLITYIQKNASGSAIFGGTAAVAESSEEAQEKRTTVTHDETQHKTDVQAAKMDKVHPKDSTEVITADTYDEEDDFELQIKSIMLKKPLATATTTTEITTANGSASFASVVDQKTPNITRSIVSAEPHADENNQNFDDELEDFRHDPTAHLAVDDFCSVGSAAPTVTEDGEDTVEDFNTEEDEGVEEPFLDLAHEIETFADREIIVLNDAELNSSIASDALSEDPLAIDDLTQPSRLSDFSANPLDSSTSTNDEEASTSQDLVWLNMGSSGGAIGGAPADVGDNIDGIKKSMTTPRTVEKDENTPQKSTLRGKASAAASNDGSDRSAHNKSEEQAEELRSDGSDSGLGSETSALQITLNSGTDTSEMISVCNTPTSVQTPTLQEKAKNAVNSSLISATGETPTLVKPPLRSNLKRRLIEIEADEEEELSSCVLNASDASASSAVTSSSTVIVASQQKKLKRSINFDNVQVYYFPRQQGFGCVPSAGGCTLGMAAHHVAFKTLTLAEHAAELRRAHRLQLQEINPRGSSSDDSEESEEDYLSEGSGSDLDAESNGFLQPVSPKQRRALLKAAGVRKIDASEKVECRDIRNSREVCGCTCRDFCDPETCACSQAGIKCQVDRAMFPCGCSRDACGNSVGRVEFNPARVRTHFIHTIMRLEMESRQQPNRPFNTGSGGVMIYGMATGMSASSSAIAGGAASATAAQTTLYYGSSLQPQSNYSSGYASPAYTNELQPSVGNGVGGGYYQPQSATSASYGVGGVPSISAADMHATPPQYQLDSLDSNLFSGSVTATPSYGELMPTYSNASTATSPGSFHNLNYATIGSSLQVSAYSSYHHHQTTAAASTSSSYLPQSHSSTIVPPASTYSSCAVPSVPPYGTATTTAAAPLYHSIALETTTAPSASTTIIDGGIDVSVDDSSFISLNTPIVSSSRLSQINDLLQHNRNTTAALVAVSQCPNVSAMRVNAAITTSSSASIDTPPIDDTHKSCLAFEELSPPLNPTPIVAVMETATSKASLSQTEPPPCVAAVVDNVALVSALTAAASTNN